MLLPMFGSLPLIVSQASSFAFKPYLKSTTSPLLTYPVLVHTFIFLIIFDVLCCPKLTFERSSCLEPYFFASMEEQTSYLTLEGAWGFLVEAFCYSQCVSELCWCVNMGGREANCCTFLTGTIFIHPDQLVTFFPTLSPLFSNKSILGWAKWQQLPCGLTRTFIFAIKEMLFAPFTSLSVFYSHVRENKFCFFLLFLPPTNIKYFYYTANTYNMLPEIKYCFRIPQSMLSSFLFSIIPLNLVRIQKYIE